MSEKKTPQELTAEALEAAPEYWKEMTERFPCEGALWMLVSYFQTEYFKYHIASKKHQEKPADEHS